MPTSERAPILQEIVNRPGWAEGKHSYDYSPKQCRQVKDAKIGIVSGQCGVLGVNACLLLGNDVG